MKRETMNRSKHKDSAAVGRQRTSTAARPLAIGMGLVSLDVVFGTKGVGDPKTFAGGTCGNVLMALAYLGWTALPITRLRSDQAATRVIEDLKKWNVETTHVSVAPDGSTPIIIQRIRRLQAGGVRHTFSWRCPSCGAHLPSYKPVLASAIEQLSLRLPAPSVYFFDRVSRSTLLMAQISRRRGAVVVFEPSGIGDPALFREAWSVAHCVKYSHERLSGLPEVDLSRECREGVLLEVETTGADGLRFRSRLPQATTRGWESMPAFTVSNVVDAAGAGDWCTAGILSKLTTSGLAGFQRTTPSDLRGAMRYGQALSAWNCQFEGARGGMYEVTSAECGALVSKLLSGSDDRRTAPSLRPKLGQVESVKWCGSCHVQSSRPAPGLHKRTAAR